SRQTGQSEDNAEENPKISVKDKIFVGLDAGKRHGEKEKFRVPENNKRDWKPKRTSHLFYDSPRGKQDRETHDRPEYETSRAHLKNNCAEATFHAYRWRFYMEDTRDILRTERLGAYTISVGPTLIFECTQEIANRIIPGDRKS